MCVCVAHYDGAEVWPFSAHNGGSKGAIERAQRLNAVPKFLTGECNLQTGIAYNWLRDTAGINMSLVTAFPSGFRDHTGFWIS